MDQSLWDVWGNGLCPAQLNVSSQDRPLFKTIDDRAEGPQLTVEAIMSYGPVAWLVSPPLLAKAPGQNLQCALNG